MSDPDDDPLDDLVVDDGEAIRQRAGVTLAQTHRAIVRAIQQGRPNDEIALLWATRASLLGLGLSADHLVLLMGVDLDEAEDILARLSEQGLVDRA